MPAIIGYVTRVAQARIVESGIPAASPSPAAPGDVIAILAVGITSFPGCAVDALGRHCDPRCGGRSCCHAESHDCAENPEFHFMFPPFCESGGFVLASAPEQETFGQLPIFPPNHKAPSPSVHLGVRPEIQPSLGWIARGGHLPLHVFTMMEGRLFDVGLRLPGSISCITGINSLAASTSVTGEPAP